MGTINQALASLKAARDRTRKDLTRIESAIRALQTAAKANSAGSPVRRKMSAAARRKIAAAQKARWAKVKKQKTAAQ